MICATIGIGGERKKNRRPVPLRWNIVVNPFMFLLSVSKRIFSYPSRPFSNKMHPFAPMGTNWYFGANYKKAGL
jgi:hypothetical protein